MPSVTSPLLSHARHDRSGRVCGSRLALAVALTSGTVVALAATHAPTAAGARAVAQASDTILFTDGSDGSAGIYEIRADGTARRLIVDDPTVPEAQGDWAPDGRAIAYTAQDGEFWALRVARLEPLAVSVVTTGPEDFEPDWSPDGDRLLFTSYFNRDTPDQTSFVMSATVDGSDARPVLRLYNPTHFVGNPRWSPDGRRIAFTVGSAREGGELYVANADGTEARRLLDHAGWDDIDPAWSPGGERIAFAAGRYRGGTAETRHDIWLLDLATATAGTIIVDDLLDLRRPTWSPDGRRLAFDARPVAGDPGSYRIHIAPATGGTVGSPVTTGRDADWDWGTGVTLPSPSPSPSPTASAQSPTSVVEATPTSAGTPTAPVPPITPVPTLPPFPTIPTPGPTDPAPPPTFPPASATPTASANPTWVPTGTTEPRLSPSPTVSPGPTPTPTRDPGATGQAVFLPSVASRALAPRD